jgi:hypothetical protein
MSTIPALRSLRQEDLKFKVSLSYIAKLCLKEKIHKLGMKRKSLT